MREEVQALKFSDRQFDLAVTRRQMAFDVVLGILVPILVLIFDPAVFRGEFALFGRYRIFAYAAIAFGVVTLSVWLFRYRHLVQWGGLFAGIFSSGALLAFAIGVALIPLSIAALPILIGALGFTPLFTAFVFYRNGVRALRLARGHTGHSWRVASFILGVVLVVTVPTLAQWRTSAFVAASIDRILHGDAQTAADAALDLKQAFWCTERCYVDIVLAYERETDPARRDFLAATYTQLTGRDIFYATESIMD